MNNVTCTYNSVSERDMNMMFLQLLCSDDSFVKLFSNKVGNTNENVSVDEVILSKTEPHLGESDITVIVSSSSKKIGILIENKIDAIDMPEQPERYIKRGNEAVKRGDYEEFFSFIVCPDKYYKNNDAARRYPYFISYESIRDYLKTQDSPMHKVYYQQICQAIEKAKRPNKVIIDELVNTFFQEYIDYQQTNYPALDLRTKSSSNGYWVKYATRLGISLHHKIPHGKVDLTFRKGANWIGEIEVIAEWLRKHGLPKVRAVTAGESGTLCITVPKLNMRIPFEQNDINDIEKCFHAIAALSEAANIMALANKLAKNKKEE